MAPKSFSEAKLARPPQRLDSRLDAVFERSGLERFDALGIETVEELLRYYPRRYVYGETLTSLSESLGKAGQEEVVFYARIQSGHDIWPKRERAKPFFKVTAVDLEGTKISMSFFNLKPGPKPWLSPGAEGFFFGKVTMDKKWGLQLAHPDFHEVKGVSGPAAAYESGMLPIYPVRGRADSWRTGLAILRVLDQLRTIPDPLPEDVRERHGLWSLREAFEGIHRPKTEYDYREARRRFVFEEAFVLQAELARRRSAVADLAAKPRVPSFGGLVDALDAKLPFDLTAGQRTVGETIAAELGRPHPMQRLLQGDVGSGKTVAALRAMLAVVDSRGQAALLAPTEVLAQQHYRTVVDLLGPLAERGMLGGSDQGTKVALLTGSQTKAERRRNLLDTASGEAGIVIGTHALLQENVTFADLGLVVVDEQHRFGVEQRAALTAKNGGMPPHVLVMTATPIPRTVAMTVFGDLAVSTLAEKPAGRAPVQTIVVPSDNSVWMDRIWQRVNEEVVDKQHQVYVVCPRISPDEKTLSAEEIAEPIEPEEDFDDQSGRSVRDSAGEPPEARSVATVVETAAALAEGPLQGLRVEVLHGRLPGTEKDAAMRRFAAGEIDVLVATTVIEVGVDVSNASTMVIMDADWFGVSQLHQLRGRIGRGSVPGLCLLVTQAAEGTPTRDRLDAVAATTDGFELSRVDLAQRREGDILGSAQHGFRSTLRMLKVLRDEKVIRVARDDATELIADDPSLERHPELRRAVDALYGEDRAEFLEKS